MWIKAIVSAILDFLLGLIKEQSQTRVEDAPSCPGKREELDDALAKWKKEKGAK